MNHDELWSRLPAAAATGLDPAGYLYNLHDDPSILAFALVASRKFTVYRNCLIWDEVSHDNVDEWINQLDDLSDVERLVNHLHVWDIVGLDVDACQVVGDVLATCWQTTASAAFPNRSITATAVEGSYGIEVTLWTDRGEASKSVVQPNRGT